jgi:penicillin amidase
LRKVLLGLAAAGLAALAALAVFAATTFPKEKGEVRVPGLSGPVTIEIDDRGIPTIRAATAEDALFGQGYAHARDRLWQMDWQRRVGAGRLSEILGPRALPADRLLRTIGFRRAAESALAGLSDQTRRALEAYARGANACLAAEKARSAEFALLRTRPEPFTAVDSLTWAKMMAWDLAQNARDEIRRAAYVARVGPERAAQLFPAVPATPTILLDEEWLAGSGDGRRKTEDEERGPSRSSSPVSRLTSGGTWQQLGAAFDAVAALGLTGEDLGSNSWVVSGARSTTGKPLLANDPHLGLKTPSVWYIARLEAPGLSVIGATLPGVPGVIIGHNARIGWAFTSIEPDVQDLYVERVDPADPSRYFFRGAWKSFETRVETIRVRGAADVALTVRSSLHGPLVTDVLTGADRLGAPVALRWTGIDPEDTTAEALLGYGRAGNWEEFLAAARRFRAPAQNVLYADVDGHIGYTATGAIPIRQRGDGSLPVSGAGEDEWIGTIPFEKLPRVLDPPRGFLVAANNRVASSRYPYLITADWPEPYRAMRITELIQKADRLSPEAFASIQLDEVSNQVRELLPLLLDAKPSGPPERDALERLSRWDGSFAADSVAASIYAAWYSALSAMPEDELGEATPGNVRSRFLIGALSSGSAWCDDVRTPARETCADFKAAALSRALALLRGKLGADPAAWQWRRLHVAREPHDVFDRVPFLGSFFSLEARHGGDASTVNVGAYRRDGTFVMTAGPSYRQVFDFSDLTKSRFVIPTGQSGNVFDARYRDQLPLWLEGRYLTPEKAPAVKTLVLLPN